MNYKEIINSSFFKETYTQIEELKKDYYVNHGFIHIYNVMNNAKYLAKLFNLTQKQEELLLIASALHDIGYLKGREHHAQNGGILAFEFLKDKMPKEEVENICRAISSHGGKEESDFKCPVSMCLILADKLDFVSNRYKDDGKEHKNLPVFLTIEKTLLTKVADGEYVLKIFTTNKHLFKNIEENSFFNKLFAVFDRLEKACGYKVKTEIIETERDCEIRI